MCGILGLTFVNNESSEIIQNTLNSELLLKNRGPDDRSLTITKDYLFIFTRLAINGLSSLSNQPFKNNIITLLCNGEIFNHKFIENEYNLTCKSDSDCECILHLYEKIGFEKMLDKLDGDFAIILYDNNKLYFARDRIGVRPLFMGWTTNGNFIVASTARSLDSFCKKIEPIVPGWGIYDYKTRKVIHYNYNIFIEKRVWKENAQEIIRNYIINSVKNRTMSDRPIGCLLSGGLDSSLICSILCKILGEKNVRTYSIGMKGSEDLKNAEKVSKYLGTNHTEILFTPEEGFNAIPEVIRDLESYDITTIRASVGMWLMAKYIKENTEDIVLYSGEGADELFCGYLYFHYAPSVEELGIESRRLVKNLYLYDVLRADRCISSHGLELRVPFLDKNLVKFCLEIDPKQICPQKNIEKYILRESFKGNYLPNEILWRRKDGMSDGISGDSGKKWFEQIKEKVDEIISDKEYTNECNIYPSKEAYYYKKIYDTIFKTFQPEYEYWLPKWVECNGDPSGRILNIYKKNNI